MSYQDNKHSEVTFNSIGTIRTPYHDWAPSQPIEQEKAIGKFKVVVDEKYIDALIGLDRFAYVILLFHLDGVSGQVNNTVSPPWAKGKTAGMFATRTPNRPNPIGMSIVRLVKIEGNEIITWPIDVFDNTPLLDIKPYFAGLDSKDDANIGWAEDVEDSAHFMGHLRGIPHDHGHDHDHDHAQNQDHDHDHDHAHEHHHHDSSEKHHLHHHHDGEHHHHESDEGHHHHNDEPSHKK